MKDKIKILTLSDHPLHLSGVGTQTRYFCESLLKSGDFKIYSLGGAKVHSSMDILKIDPYGEDWTIHPVKGYGNPEIVRAMVRHFKPDVVWFMTDPRFWGWLVQIEEEIRSLCSLAYYHVWDNYPYPMYNKPFYESIDHIYTISKLTDDIVRNVSPEVGVTYVPHSIPENFYRPLDSEEDKIKLKAIRKKNFSDLDDNGILFFWNSRNARRKLAGTTVSWMADIINKYGRDKVALLMHTDPNDVHGPNLNEILKLKNLNNGEIKFSPKRAPFDHMNIMYNMSDCLINISDAEGFGLSALEALNAAKPVIATKTGGLQDQVTDGKNVFGALIEPSSQIIVGSQQTPYIYEDRISEKDFKKAVKDIILMPKSKRERMGIKGREHILKNFNFDEFQKTWVCEMKSLVEKNGRWGQRKDFKAWEIIDL